MTTKRRKLLAMLLLAVIGSVILLNRSDKPEPEYQRRRLTEWLERASQPSLIPVASQIRECEEAVQAVRSIGTNAVPCLLNWINYEPSAWRAIIGQKLPRIITDTKLARGFLDPEAETRWWLARFGFQILGTNAASAVPKLEALMKDGTKPMRAGAAIMALGDLGETAIPILKSGLADTNQIKRHVIVYSIESLGHGYGTNACVPILMEALKDDSLLVREAATNALQHLAPKAITNATAPQTVLAP